MDLEERITGIILAGGNSTRFGNDKSLLKLDGRTLLERAADMLAPFCAEILISSNNPGHGRFGFKTVPDERVDKGPMMGIFSALNFSTTRMNLIIAVDNVWVGRDYFDYLLSHDLADFDAAVPFLENRYFEPLVGFYSKSILKRMSRMIEGNNFRLPDLLQQANILKLDVAHDFAGFNRDYFRSLNTMQELTRIQD